MADVCTLGSLNLNDGSETFVGYGVDLGHRVTEFDEVRSYTGSIRQVDVHQSLVDVVIPMKVVGSTADALYDKLVTIKSACVAGGTLTWQASGEDVSQTFTVGCSPEPEVIHNEVYRLRNIALIELHLKRMP